MTRKFLEDLGIDKEHINKILDEHGGDVEKAKKPAEALTAERDALQARLGDLETRLKAFDEKDFDGLSKQVGELTSQLESARQAHDAEVRRIQREADTKDFLSGLKFVNSETREYYAAKLDAALTDDANAGKNRKDILDALTAGEDGKPRGGVFAAPENPNQVSIPPAGDVLGGAPRKFEPPKII